LTEENEKIEREEWTRKDAVIAILIMMTGIYCGALFSLFLGLLG
jgi:hypothetical protein